jgi:serine-type D-Ala-D-Ala carboxypeptidase (penicillin-binding protein 5/6)
MFRLRRLRAAGPTVGAATAVLIAGLTSASCSGPSAVALPAAIGGHARMARAARPAPAGIAAYAAELASGRTGKQMWGRRQYSPRPIASLTKVMTALVVIRSGDLNRRITITWADAEYVCCGIMGAGLRPGDVLTARQLLYAMLLPSGADAALALATSYGPGWPAFVAKMNATARRLHLVGTHFTNFDGVLSSDVSTPRNLLLLGEAAMRQHVFREVVQRRWYRVRAGPHHHRYFWRSTNLLLGHYPGLIGIKTGWTPDAGECLLFEATKGRRVLIGVVLDSAPTKTGQTFIDAARMLNWGFRQHAPLPRLHRLIPVE